MKQIEYVNGQDTGKKNRGKLVESVLRTLFIFGVVGCVSVLVDLDHIWKYILNVEEPISFTWGIGRPFHHPIIFFIIACISSWFVITFVYGWYDKVLKTFGPRKTGIFMITTYVFIYWVLFTFCQFTLL